MTQTAESRAPRHKAKRDRMLALITIALAALGALLLAEIAVRLLVPVPSPDKIREHSMQYDPAAFAGYLLKPVDRFVDLDRDKAWGRKTADEPSEHAIFISANGYRGPAFAVRKPAGTLRIVALGASSVFDGNASDSQDDLENTWPHLMGKRLRERGYDNVEVINAGVPGHTSANSLARLYTQLWMYEPDIVLIYHGWNDFKFWRQLEISPEQPLIARYANYDPYQDPFIHYQGGLDRLLSNSQLYSTLRMRYFQWRLDPGAEGVSSDDRAPASTFSDFGPQQFQLNLELFVKACETIGASPVLLTQATLVAPDNSGQDRQRIGYRYMLLDHDGIVAAYERSYRIVADISERTGAQLIDVAAQMNGRSALFKDHVHTTTAGSVELARIVAAELDVGDTRPR